MEGLEQRDPREADVSKLHYFARLTMEDAAGFERNSPNHHPRLDSGQSMAVS